MGRIALAAICALALQSCAVAKVGSTALSVGAGAAKTSVKAGAAVVDVATPDGDKKDGDKKDRNEKDRDDNRD